MPEFSSEEAEVLPSDRADVGTKVFPSPETARLTAVGLHIPCVVVQACYWLFAVGGYSIRSWPGLSVQILSFQIKSMILVTFTFSNFSAVIVVIVEECHTNSQSSQNWVRPPVGWSAP